MTTKVAKQMIVAEAAGRLADKLGDVKAKIADLEKREKNLKSELIATGVVSADGEYFHATVSNAVRESVDWKALLEEYNPPKLRELIEKYTKVSEYPVVKVFSR